MASAASLRRRSELQERMKPHLRRGRKAKDKRVERAAARQADRKQAA